jgi:hypothetical protein
MMLVVGLDHGSNACRNTFMSATKLASLDPVAIQAVTGAGRPLVEGDRGDLEPEAHHQ